VETAAALWNAIDKFGNTVVDFGMKQEHRFLSALSKVPQDPASVARTVQFLQLPDLDQHSTRRANQVLEGIPLPLLQADQPKIFSVMHELSRTRLQTRLNLAELPPAELWKQLADLSEQSEDLDEPDHDTAGALVEALANHPDFSAAHAVEVITDPRDRWWLEIRSATLLGKIRHFPAIDPLIEKMAREDEDFLREESGRAVVKFPPEISVPKLQAAYAGGDPFYRTFVAEMLANVMHPLAETALLQLLEHEEDNTPATALALGLCDLCTTEGNPQLREFVLADWYDPFIAQIKEDFVTLCAMNGFEFPELAAWRHKIKDPVHRRKYRNKFLSKFGMDSSMVDQFSSYLQGQKFDPTQTHDTSPANTPALPPTLPAAESTTPFRRAEPKIGRNDPCPCGSGKKYKKCCG
jgi:hypothetical protein